MRLYPLPDIVSTGCYLLFGFDRFICAITSNSFVQLTLTADVLYKSHDALFACLAQE